MWVFAQVNAVGIGRMYLHDAFGTESFQFTADVTVVVRSILEVVVNLDIVALDSTQEPYVPLGIHACTDADNNAFPACHLACSTQAHNERVAGRAVHLPVLAASTKGQKRHFTSKQAHGVEAVNKQVFIIGAMKKTLRKEAAHGDRGYGHTIANGSDTELLCLGGIA